MWAVGVDHLLNLRVVWGGGYAHELFKFGRLDSATMGKLVMEPAQCHKVVRFVAQLHIFTKRHDMMYFKFG